MEFEIGYHSLNWVKATIQRIFNVDGFYYREMWKIFNCEAFYCQEMRKFFGPKSRSSNMVNGAINSPNSENGNFSEMSV